MCVPSLFLRVIGIFLWGRLVIFYAHSPTPRLIFISTETITLYVGEGAYNVVRIVPDLTTVWIMIAWEHFTFIKNPTLIFVYGSFKPRCHPPGGAWWQWSVQSPVWDTALSCAAELVRHLRWGKSICTFLFFFFFFLLFVKPSFIDKMEFGISY